MESYSDSDDDWLEIGMNGDEDIVIDTEHASREVDTEGEGEAVTGMDGNSCLGKIFPRQKGEEHGKEESINNELNILRRKLKYPAILTAAA